VRQLDRHTMLLMIVFRRYYENYTKTDRDTARLLGAGGSDRTPVVVGVDEP
jgi:hypothetical protein